MVFKLWWKLFVEMLYELKQIRYYLEQQQGITGISPNEEMEAWWKIL